MEIKDLLMTIEEKNKIGVVRDHYFTIAENGHNRLFYCGIAHSNDPGHPQNTVIKKRWKSFLQETKGRSRLAMVEGGLRNVPSDEVGAIKAQGDAGLLTFLANKDKVGIISPEPNAEKEFEELCKCGYRTQEIEYYYFARNIGQWERVKDQYSFEDYMKRHLRDTRYASFRTINSLEEMRMVHQDLFGGDINEHDVAFFEIITATNYFSTKINNIARDSSRVRDVCIVKQIKESWDDGKSIFIVFGAAHAVIQEPALRKLLS